LDAADPTAEARTVRLSEGKDLWRDSAALFQFDNLAEFRPPRNLAWLRELKEEGCLPSDRAFMLSAIGLCTDKAKVNFWRHETLPLPSDYLTDKDLVHTLKAAIQLAENVGEQVRFAVAAMARLALTADPQKSPDKNRQWQMVDAIGADALYWSRLERKFGELLENLPGSIAHQQDRLRNWFQCLRAIALDCFKDAAEWPQLHGREQRAAVEGEAHLLRNLGRIGKAYRNAKPTTTGATT
jgi:CRISPR system Cascade subunit CasA